MNVCFCVDDIIYTRNLMLENFQSAMKIEFEMTDLGLMKYFLGIQVEQSNNRIFICKQNYVKNVLNIFKTTNCKPTDNRVETCTKLSEQDQGSVVDPTLYKILVSILMHLIAIRPNIMYDVSLISKFMEIPKYSRWQEGNRILRYITGTTNFGIMCSATNSSSLVGYTGSDFESSIDDIKITLGYVFHLESGLISCASKKHPIVSIYSTKIEFVAATSTYCHVVWLRIILEEIQHKENEATKIFCDNNSAITLFKNHVFHRKSKHIDTRYHFIKELVK